MSRGRLGCATPSGVPGTRTAAGTAAAAAMRRRGAVNAPAPQASSGPPAQSLPARAPRWATPAPALKCRAPPVISSPHLFEMWTTHPPLRSAVVRGACSYSSTWRETPPPDAQRFFNATPAGRETCTPGIQSHPACCVNQTRLNSLTAAHPTDYRRSSWPTEPPPAAPRRPLMPPAPAASLVRQSGYPLDNWTAPRERWRHHMMHSSVAGLSACFTKGRLAARASGTMLTGHRSGQRMFHDGQAGCKSQWHNAHRAQKWSAHVSRRAN